MQLTKKGQTMCKKRISHSEQTVRVSAVQYRSI